MDANDRKDNLNLINLDFAPPQGPAAGTAPPPPAVAFPPSPSATWAGADHLQPAASAPLMPTMHTTPLIPSPLNAPSVAASESSSLASLRRREDARFRFDRDSALRLQQRQAQLLREHQQAEQQRWEAESAALRAKDEASRLGDDLDWAGEDPVPPDSQVESLTRQLQELKAQLEERGRLEDLAARFASAPVVEEAGNFVDIGSRYKPKSPSPWTGAYDYQERETWIATAKGWLGSLGLKLTNPIDQVRTPSAYFALRSLMSDSKGSSGISPSGWFDARMRTRPFATANDLFDAIRSHWHDEQAHAKSFDKYRDAKQGGQTARDYGVQLSALADACLTHTIPEHDKLLTYLRGLRVDVAEFVRTQMATLKLQGREVVTLDEVITIAAVTDELPSFRRKTAPAAAPATSAPKRSASEMPLTDSPADSSTSSAERHAQWQARATTWQTDNPDKAKWFNKDAPKPRQPMRCYNCGQARSDHLSSACPKARVAPSLVIAAARIAQSTAGTAAPAPSPTAAPKGSDPRVAAATLTEVPEDEGKADGALV